MDTQITSKSYLKIISSLAKRYRIYISMTQQELADRSGISLRSVQNFEAGADIKLENFIRILIELGLVHQLNALIPDVTERPSAKLKEHKEKKRVRHSNKTPERSFAWGDEK